MRQGIGDLTGAQWGHIVRGAKERKIQVSLTKEEAWELYLRQGGLCALTGKPITLQPYWGTTGGKKSDGTASLDRKDSSTGYVAGNVQWVHKLVNIMKNTMTDEELISWCSAIVEYKGVSNVV